MFEMDNLEPLYASVDEDPETSASTVREVTFKRQNSIRRKGSKAVKIKPPLPPSQTRNLKHRDTYAKTGKRVSVAEDGTSISDDLETEPHSMPHVISSNTKFSYLKPINDLLPQDVHEPLQGSRGVRIISTRHKDVERHNRKENNRSRSASKKLSVSEMSDSGFFQSVTETKDPAAESHHSAGNTLPANTIDLEYIPEQLQRILHLYQMKLTEKDRLLEEYEAEVLDKEINLQTIERENQNLKKFIADMQAQTPVPVEEWKLLREQAQLVLDENESLNSQLDHLQVKLRENHVAHVKQATLLRQALNTQQDEKKTLQEELNQVQNRFEILRDEYNLLRLRSQDQMSREEHSEAVRECKGLLDELKAKYQHDIDHAATHIKVLQKEKFSLTLNVTKLNGENQQLEVENKVLLQTHRKFLTKLRQVKKAYTKCKAENLDVKVRLKMLQNQVFVLEEYCNKYSKMAVQLSDEIIALLSQIEDSALNAESIHQLRLAKIRLMEKLHDESARLNAANNAFQQQKLDYDRRLHQFNQNIASKKVKPGKPTRRSKSKVY